MTDSKFTRRDFLKASLAGSSALVAPTIINYLGQSSPSSDKEFLEVRDGNFYMGGEEYMLKGANYLTRDHPWQMFKKYDPEQIEKELEIAAGMGINAVRVGLMFPDASGSGQPPDIPLEQIKPQEDYFQNFQDFLGIADDKEMKVLPIAMDWPRWGLYMPKYYELAKNYLEVWMPEFTQDERILGWEIASEPGLTEDNFEKEEEEDKYRVKEYIGEMSEMIKEIDNNHPVTVSLKAVNNDKILADLPEYLNCEDFISFHCYYPMEYVYKSIDKIHRLANKPIFLEEFGLPTGDEWQTEEHQKRFYDKRLSAAKERALEGIMFWELNDHAEEATENNPYVIEDDYIKHMGVLRTDYSKKPAAHVVQQYYKWIL